MAVAHPCIIEAHGSWLSTVSAARPVEEADEVGAEVKVMLEGLRLKAED